MCVSALLFCWMVFLLFVWFALLCFLVCGFFGGHLLSLVRRCLTLYLMIYEILQSAHRPSDSRWRLIFSLPISTFSALGVSHVMRSINVRYLLTYLLTLSQTLSDTLSQTHRLSLTDTQTHSLTDTLSLRHYLISHSHRHSLTDTLPQTHSPTLSQTHRHTVSPTLSHADTLSQTHSQDSLTDTLRHSLTDTLFLLRHSLIQTHSHRHCLTDSVSQTQWCITLAAKWRRRQNMTRPWDSTFWPFTSSSSRLQCFVMSVIHDFINPGLSRTSTRWHRNNSVHRTISDTQTTLSVASSVHDTDSKSDSWSHDLETWANAENVIGKHLVNKFLSCQKFIFCAKVHVSKFGLNTSVNEFLDKKNKWGLSILS